MVSDAHDFGLALAKISAEHRLHNVTSCRQHGFMCSASSVVQLKDDVGEEPLVEADVLQAPLEEIFVGLVGMVGADERMFGEQDEQLGQFEEFRSFSGFLQVEGAAIDGTGVGELETLVHRPRSDQFAQSDNGLPLGLHVSDAVEGGMVEFSCRRQGLAAGPSLARFLFGSDETLGFVGEVAQRADHARVAGAPRHQVGGEETVEGATARRQHEAMGGETHRTDDEDDVGVDPAQVELMHVFGVRAGHHQHFRFHGRGRLEGGLQKKNTTVISVGPVST